MNCDVGIVNCGEETMNCEVQSKTYELRIVRINCEVRVIECEVSAANCELRSRTHEVV